MYQQPLSWLDLYLYPVLVALLLWGLLTWGLLVVNRRGPLYGRVALVASLGPLALAHWQLWLVRDDLSIGGCYRAFAAGLVIWAWHELAFYSGVLTGPWRRPCPPTARGWMRFSIACSTHLYHELAVAFEVILLWRLHLDALNVFGPLTFVLLWALLHSAKLNVFLGVRTLTIDWLPDHLHYLGSFWRQRPFNALFLPTVAAFSLLAMWLWMWAGALESEKAVGVALLAVLAVCGVLEHWLLVLPAPQRKPAETQDVAST
ncbi:MAG: putative photosynthetic complex assembly protein PuhE [Chloroflexaceae bacterium]|jgi:putative photosynthetic complex assembly protein 2|nr:putative photosynthetic complex assembly protein PuhE [Chloroflexaceae bacterium]